MKSPKKTKKFSSNKNLFENQNDKINKTLIKIDLNDLKKSLVSPNQSNKSIIARNSYRSNNKSNKINMSTKKDNSLLKISLLY